MHPSPANQDLRIKLADLGEARPIDSALWTEAQHQRPPVPALNWCPPEVGCRLYAIARNVFAVQSHRIVWSCIEHAGLCHWSDIFTGQVGGILHRRERRFQPGHGLVGGVYTYKLCCRECHARFESMLLFSIVNADYAS